jgi:hypothetical protein
MWEGWSRNVQILACTSKNRAIWAKLKNAGIFNPDFVIFVDRLIQERDARDVAKSTAIITGTI